MKCALQHVITIGLPHHALRQLVCLFIIVGLWYTITHIPLRMYATQLHSMSPRISTALRRPHPFSGTLSSTVHPSNGRFAFYHDNDVRRHVQRIDQHGLRVDERHGSMPVGLTYGTHKDADASKGRFAAFGVGVLGLVLSVGWMVIGALRLSCALGPIALGPIASTHHYVYSMAAIRGRKRGRKTKGQKSARPFRKSVQHAGGWSMVFNEPSNPEWEPGIEQDRIGWLFEKPCLTFEEEKELIQLMERDMRQYARMKVWKAKWVKFKAEKEESTTQVAGEGNNQKGQQENGKAELGDRAPSKAKASPGDEIDVWEEEARARAALSEAEWAAQAGDSDDDDDDSLADDTAEEHAWSTAEVDEWNEEERGGRGVLHHDDGSIEEGYDALNGGFSNTVASEDGFVEGSNEEEPTGRLLDDWGGWPPHTHSRDALSRANSMRIGLDSQPNQRRDHTDDDLYTARSQCTHQFAQWTDNLDDEFDEWSSREPPPKPKRPLEPLGPPLGPLGFTPEPPSKAGVDVVQVFWDVRSAPPTSEPAVMVESLYSMMAELGVKHVKSIKAYPDQSTLNELVNTRVNHADRDILFGDFEDFDGYGLCYERCHKDRELWIAEWTSAEMSPFRCLYCGEGKSWATVDKLRLHIAQHSRELAQQMAHLEARKPPLSDRNLPRRRKRLRAAKRRLRTWDLAFRQAKALERQMRAGSLPVHVVMPSPPTNKHSALGMLFCFSALQLCIQLTVIFNSLLGANVRMCPLKTPVFTTTTIDRASPERFQGPPP